MAFVLQLLRSVMIRSLTLVLCEMKRKLWAVNRAQAAYRQLRPLLMLPVGWADLAVPGGSSCRESGESGVE